MGAPGVRPLRKAAGLSQAVLAEKAGITKATLVRMELGQLDPRLSTLRKLATVLRVPVAALLEESRSHRSRRRKP